FWDEIRALYVWQGPDWRLITLGILLSPIAALLGGVTFAEALPSLGPWTGAILFGLGCIVLCCVLAIRIVPSRWFRLDTLYGPITFNTRHRRALGELLAHLSVTP